MTEDTKPETVTMTYCGRRLTTKDTLIYEWIADGETETRWYKKQLVSYAGIGTRWTFVCGEGTTVKLNPRPQSDGKVPDDSLRMSWEALDRDAGYQYEEVRVAKSEKDKSLIADAVRPLRVAMARHNTGRRYAFNTAVMAELMRPLTKAEREDAGL
jgi:hypothetical protein